MSMITSLINQLRTYAKIADQLEKLRGKEQTGVVKALYEAADTIEELSAKLHGLQMERSSQYYHGGWIPCSERLPEMHEVDASEEFGEDCRYRITEPVLGYLRREYDDEKMVVVELVEEDIVGRRWHTVPDGMFVDVIAWMPLPEPYRGKTE